MNLSAAVCSELALVKEALEHAEMTTRTFATNELEVLVADARSINSGRSNCIAKCIQIKRT